MYAARSDGDEPSQVYYRPYDSWSSQADWTVNLSPGEEVLTVAAGGEGGDSMGSAIVATNKGYVRFLTSSGIQRYLWRIGEEVVTLAAGKDAAMVVHREGGTSLDGQSRRVRREPQRCVADCRRLSEPALLCDRPRIIRPDSRRANPTSPESAAHMGRVQQGWCEYSTVREKLPGR